MRSLKKLSNVFILFLMLFTFGSCLEDPKFDNAKEATYAFNFEKRYGEIAPDQDWGFKKVETKAVDTYRIIAEDLGNTGDFDFNDVVFDFYKTGSEYVVTLQAVGGTLPLYIGGQEVHEAFGVSQSTFVNTSTLKLPPVTFKTNNLDIIVGNVKAKSYVLKAECGKAPQKICVPTTYEWTEEHQSIEDKYPKFKDWVGNKYINWIE